MEDLEFVRNLRPMGRTDVANQPVEASDRRWRTHGSWRMTLLNQVLILAYLLGFDPTRLHQWRESGIILRQGALPRWTQARWPSGGRMQRADGNDAAYESWVRAYSSNVYRCALRLCGQADTAEELTQEVFFEAWRSMHSLRDPDRARPWLLSILRHRYMHWLRDQKRRPDDSTAAQHQAEQMGSGEPLPGETLANQESLQAALSDLEDRYKLPLLLVFLEGFTCQQAAEFLDVPLGTVLSRIHRAKQFLRERLRDDVPRQPHLRIHHEPPAEPQPRSAGFGGAS
jgi:RNA polymerase sigma-70 factor, ECF subfamily